MRLAVPRQPVLGLVLDQAAGPALQPAQHLQHRIEANSASRPRTYGRRGRSVASGDRGGRAVRRSGADATTAPRPAGPLPHPADHLPRDRHDVRIVDQVDLVPALPAGADQTGHALCRHENVRVAIGLWAVNVLLVLGDVADQAFRTLWRG